MRERLLAKLGYLAGEKTWWMLGFIIIATIIFGTMAGQLEMNMNLTGLLPEDDPMVDEFNYIFKEFNGASTAFIVIEGEMDEMIRYADNITPKIKTLKTWIEANGSNKVKEQHQVLLDKVKKGKAEFSGEYFGRVDYKQPLDFMKDHGIMLIKPSDLKNTKDLFYNPNLLPFLTNLNNSLEKEYIQSEEKISTTQKERSAVRFLDGIEDWVDNTSLSFYEENYDKNNAIAAANAVSLGSPYFISPDRSMLLIMAEPTFSIMNMDLLMPGINGLEELVKTSAKNFDVKAGLAGGIVLGRDEMVAGMEDSMMLTGLALLGVLILFIVTFRMFSAPFLAVINLIIGLIWAMGVSWLVVGTLNMMTAMMAVVLVGLGIDFSIHIISVYTELINIGKNPKKAIVETMEKVGTGIITGGFTTAAAFLTLLIGRSAGISEFGLVNGVGLIVIMIATLITMPTLLMVKEKLHFKSKKKKLVKTKDISYGFIGKISQSVYNKWKLASVIILVLTIFFGYMMTKVTFDYNYLNMEPEGLESIILNDKIIEKFNMSSDATMMTAKSLEKNYQYTKEAKKKSSVSNVESLTDYLPTPEEQNNRKPGIIAIKNQMENTDINNSFNPDNWDKLVEEIQRLEYNVIEMQDMAFVGGQDMIDMKATRLVGNPEKPNLVGNLTDLVNKVSETKVDAERMTTINSDFGNTYKNIVLDMADPSEITIDMLPNMIKDKYISKNGDRYLISIYPKGDVWNIKNLEVFANEALEISDSISGTPPMFYFLLKIIGEDGRNAALLTLLVVFLFLWLDFKSIKYSFLAMVPLIFGIITMVGIMGIFNIQITLLNVMAIPLIIGIGIDDGVHLLHRYKIEGNRSINTVFRSTGKAITITSFTTMISFGSLVFAVYRGYGSMGIALFIGVGACLVTSLFILPALLGFIERNDNN